MKFSESSKTNTSCPIFYVDFEPDSDVIELPCNHVFTPDGIEKWLKEEKNECPICRFELKSKEVLAEEKKFTQEDSDDEEEEDEESNEEPLHHRPSIRNNRRNLSNSLNSAYSINNQSNDASGNVPHSYLDLLMAREEEMQMEQAILASLRDLEESNNNEDDSNTPPDNPPID